MDGRKRWADNIMVERWFRTLKEEEVYINEYRSPKELRAGLAAYIEKYNSKRLHESLDYMTPDEMFFRSFSLCAG